MKLPPEIESGNIEYKLKITTDSDDRIEQLATQLKWRIHEGNGIAIYMIGVADDGSIPGINYTDYISSLKNFSKMTNIINAKILSKEKKVVSDQICYYVINITSETKDIKSLRIIFIGPTNSGKSTIVANLSKRITDDGNGKSRKYVFNHKHEIYSGETSSLSINNLRVPYKNINLNINLIDTPGNEKYRKTMITGISKYLPNYLFLVIDPLEIDINTLSFYLEILKYYKYPFHIILTKKDKYKSLHKNYLLKNILDICKKDFNDKNIKKVPLIEVNNLNNEGYQNILKVMKKSSENINLNNLNNIDIQICDVLNVPNFPKIYTGLTYRNISQNNKHILVSSDKKYNIEINSIYFLDKPKDVIGKDHLITFTLKNDIQIDNKSDLLIISKDIKEEEILLIKSNKIINGNQGLCIFNNQYSLVKIIQKTNNTYEIINFDNSKFINISKKIIIKINDDFYFTNLVS